MSAGAAWSRTYVLVSGCVGEWMGVCVTGGWSGWDILVWRGGFS